MSTKEHERKKLWNLLGELPDRSRQISCIKVAEEERGTYILERLVLDLNGIEPVPAYFVRPVKQQGKFPTILYNHAHGGDYSIGKEELLIGRKSLKTPYAEELCKKGYAALCIDTWAFGERRGRSEDEIFREMLWKGQVMWGMMVFDSIRAIDYLITRNDVDSDRIGTLGMSMGSTMAWWTAALDERVKVCIDICCMTDFHSLIESRGLELHGIYYYVPRLLQYFTTAGINRLIAPRPHLCLAGNYDPLTPPKGLEIVDAELKKVYLEESAPDAWKMVRYDTGHYETDAMRKEVLNFIEQML